jgi:hypothetical protein
MIPFITVCAAFETASTGVRLTEESHPTAASVVVFAVFAAITAIGMVLYWLSRDEN